MWRKAQVGLGLLLAFASAGEPVLDLPPRHPEALGGTRLAADLAPFSLEQREIRVEAELLAGNIPDALRKFVPVRIRTGTNELIVYALPNYLALGSDSDYLFTPLSPGTAKRIAERLNATLPTTRLVDWIFSNAVIRLQPVPIPPDNHMTSVSRFLEHTRLIQEQLAGYGPLPRVLMAGHKKDLVQAIRTKPGHVAIYGWHRTNGVPIQPLYTGHSEKWVDYSQCVRLVHNQVLVNGVPMALIEVLRDPQLAKVLGSEASGLEQSNLRAVTPTGRAEESEIWKLGRGVRALVNRPASGTSGPEQCLVFYALPNGNSLEQTFGDKNRAAEDWRFGIQHIGGQMRFVRSKLPAKKFVLICLENELRSWPAWRKQHPDGAIPELLSTIADRLGRGDWVLSGHSGGGSLIFGFLNASEHIPQHVKRILFLDANYAYERSHGEKLKRWLREDNDHFLMTCAYDDAVALLNGKPFVSASGGTWGRTHAMLSDFSDLHIRTNHAAVPWEYTGAEGRARFVLLPNPDRKVLHTLQVERNGFIHGLLIGTAHENDGYRYWDHPAYSEFLR